MSKENIHLVIKFIRLIIKDNRKINQNDLDNIFKCLNLKTLEDTEINRVRDEINECIESKILYFEKVEKDLKVKEYLKVKKYNLKIFEFFSNNKYKFNLETQ